MRLETIIFPVLLGAAAGCAKAWDHQILEPNQPHTITADRITHLVDQQRAHLPYGNHFHHPDNSNEYHDGLELEGHVFATTISEKRGHLVISFYGDNLVVTDVFGDGRIDSAFVFDGKYDYQRGHANNHWMGKVAPDNFYLRLFEDLVLDLIEMKYTTGAVSPGFLNRFLYAKNGILEAKREL